MLQSLFVYFGSYTCITELILQKYVIRDSLIIAMVQVSLDLRYSIVSWILILYVDFHPCCIKRGCLQGDDWV